MLGDKTNNVYEDYLFNSLEEVHKSLPGAKDIPFILGFIRGTASLNLHDFSVDCLCWFFKDMGSLQNKNSLEKINEVLNMIHEYFSVCFKQNIGCDRIWKRLLSEAMEHGVRGQYLCSESLGYFEGIKIGINHLRNQNIKISDELSSCFVELYDWLNSILEAKYNISNSSNIDSSLEKLEKEFHFYTLKLAQICHQST